MIVVRAPLRISFVGGGTDLPSFYRRTPGRVISTAVDKYVYVVINRTPLIEKVSARYSISETVDHPSELQHTRIRAALLDAGIEKNIEIGSFASFPAKTGLGSSSSFAVALVKGLRAYLGEKLTPQEAAEAASRLEIELVGEPIGKQDQYASAFGGMNVYQFNPDETVDVKPVLIDFKRRIEFENHILVFFTGVSRNASSVLTEQKKNIETDQKKFDTMRQMADSVHEFEARLMHGDFKGLCGMLHETWLRKKSLASNMSGSVIDDLYEAGIGAGAHGGKILGAGGGGSLLFIVPPEKRTAVLLALAKKAKEKGMNEARELPMKFVQSGAEVLWNGDYVHTTLA